MSNPDVSYSNSDISGPGFIALLVHDVEAAANFYEQKVGLKRDPQAFPGAVAFLSSPIPFSVTQASPAVNLDGLPTPGLGIALWFKAAESQAVHDALVEAGVTILRAPPDGRFGRQFTFVDLDGYAITIYDRDAPAEGWGQTG